MQLFNCSRLALCLAIASSAVFPAIGAQNDALTDIIVVAPRTRASVSPTNEVLMVETESMLAPDGANMVARAPGAALIDNGALSGQVQMRGLFGERVLIRINDQHFASGGPNAMDPAMHYAPNVLIDRVEIDRGLSPVRQGPGLGGGLNARLKQVDFGSDNSLRPQIDVTAQYRGSDDSLVVGGLVGLANETLRLGLIASREKGDDTRFPGGRIGGSSFDRLVIGGQLGVKIGSGEVEIEYRRQETDPTGNPPYAMDIVYFHTDFLRAGVKAEVSDGLGLEAHVGYVAVRHLMNNYDLRPAPADVSMLRSTSADADTFNGEANLRFGSDSRHFRIGADFEIVDKNVRIANPRNDNWYVTSLNRAESDRLGGFVEWRSGVGQVESELGLRVDHHRMQAAAPGYGSALTGGALALAGSFGAADRSWSGTSVDVAWRLWADLGAITPRLSLGHKTRAPSAVERFSWLPTEASGGLADGNIYVGNPQLRIEKAWLAELGFDWQGRAAYVRPTLYYRRLEDFIQGVAYDATPDVIDTPVEMVASMNGDRTPLRFANVDAQIYGADMAFGARLAGPLRVDGVASFVRGKRRDIHDNLYRVAPANIRLMLGWEAARWGLGVEGVAFARQHKVSTTNGEQPSAGYVLASILGHWSISNALRLDAGVENLFNRYYVEHLAGYNRNSGSDVAVGARLPGTGRSGFVRLRWTLGR